MKQLKLLNILLFVSFLGLTCCGIIPKPSNQTKIPIIKVLLFQMNSVNVNFTGDYNLIKNNRSYLNLPENSKVNFSIIDESIQVSCNNETLNIAEGKLIVTTQNTNNDFQVHNKQYFGDLGFEIENDKLQIVNIVDIETYLKGVVPSEIGRLNENGLDAIKAQAIASRTYALKKIESNKNFKSYDIHSGVMDQVYNGHNNHYTLSDLAVEKTKGIVLLYNNKLIDAFYHSTCGGRTEFGKNVFVNGDKPYLLGVSDNFGNGDFCLDSPHYRWKESVPFAAIEKKIRINNSGFYSNIEFSFIQDIVIAERFRSGRVKKMAIFLDKKNPIMLAGNETRQLIPRNNGQILRSTLCKIAKYGPKGNPDGFLVIGAGHGHGVGMCQWGAIGMAKKQYNYQQILNHYYRGATIKKVY